MRPRGGRQATASALSLEVADDLPIWHPTPPPGGWSPRQVWAAAADYADDHSTPEAWRRTVGNAARALFRELPTVKRAEIRERLQGIDRRADTLDLPPLADEPPF